MTTKTLIFLNWRLEGLALACWVVVNFVVTILVPLLMLWVGKLKLSTLLSALDEKASNPKASVVVMTSFWRNERVLWFFWVVATVTGTVWCYRTFVPAVEGL